MIPVEIVSFSSQSRRSDSEVLRPLAKAAVINVGQYSIFGELKEIFQKNESIISSFSHLLVDTSQGESVGRYTNNFKVKTLNLLDPFQRIISLGLMFFGISDATSVGSVVSLLSNDLNLSFVGSSTNNELIGSSPGARGVNPPPPRDFSK